MSCSQRFQTVIDLVKNRPSAVHKSLIMTENPFVFVPRNRRDAVSAGQGAWNRLKPVKIGSSDYVDQLTAVFEEAESGNRKPCLISSLRWVLFHVFTRWELLLLARAKINTHCVNCCAHKQI